MIITCPNCSTQYDVLPATLGAGKKTRCFNCGYSWFQEPVMVNIPPPVTHAAVRAMAREQGEYQQAAYAQQQLYAAPMPAQPQQMAQPVAQQVAPMPIPEAPVMTAPPPMPQPVEAPEPEPEPIPEPEPEIEPEIDAPEPEIDDEPEVEIEADAAATDFEPDDDENSGLSKADLDAMFGEDEETEPIASMVGGGGGGDDDAMSIDDIDDPDPIPQVYSPRESGDDEPAKKRSLIKMIGIGVGILLIVVLGGGFFARGMIMDMVPAAMGIYEMIGLGEKPGAGLAIQKITPSRETQGGKSVLVIKATIANISDKERPVPLIEIVLKDGKEKAIKTLTAAPLRNRLPARKKMRFSYTVTDPPPLARNFEIGFAKAKTEAKTEAKKEH